MRPSPLDRPWREILFASVSRPLVDSARRLILGAAFVLASSIAASSVNAEETAPKVWTEVTIASEGSRPPYNYFDNNELAGFEIDLGRELCSRMKVSCRFVAQDWDGLIPGLLAHQYDAIMAAMEITDAAREKIAFTKPYVRMPSAFMASRDNVPADVSPAGLAGKRLGVESGGPHQAFLEDLYKQSEIHAYATLEEAVLDLAESRLDAVIGDKDALDEFIRTRHEAQNCVFVSDVPRDPVYFGDGDGVGLRKSDVALKAMFEKALDSVMEDGTFAKIRAKYFNFDIN
ncbi:transporter substrate-binding domain-containing protein [Methylocapsa palsarum]|uniref:Polar amino acid transport system substrate-binding protein n=1 Tax=Methylocapsa palsarum TaxID=1612308 RepID=A0A1I3ZJQ9_9HYPH|nr:transporter substrate-binding domain-containing protein [Methylocapsa palsarum]SFK43931.1 polar amino acid transport system substrate-binding protein [Methylocapsa palsarum]